MNGNESSPFPPPPQQPGGNEKFTAPPAPQVELRTMGSDLSSIQRGEASPVPESVMAPPAPGREPSFRPETQFDTASFMASEEAAPKKGKKMILWTSVGVAVIVVAAIGYIVFPLISGEEAPLPPPPPGDLVPPPAEPPPPPAVEHRSFFTSPPAAVANVNLGELSAPGITGALQTLSSSNPLSSGSVQEVAVALAATGQPATFSGFISAFIPEFGTGNPAAWFEDDFTAFLYYDANGAWPGYIARVKNGVNLDEVRGSVGGLVEGRIAELGKFYLASPGTFGAFKSGQANGQATRYAVGGAPGASFNYGVFGSYFITSTSFNGLKAALPLLGL